MRHKIYGKHLRRDKDERDRLFKGLISQLIIHGSIKTSASKAKAIKGLVDKVINLAKSKNSQRLLQTYLPDKSLRERLIEDIVPKLGDRNSGYTSLVRMGRRLGDQTMMVKMSLIGAEELKPIKEEVSRVEKVSQVPRGDKKKTRDTRSPREASAKRGGTRKSRGTPRKKTKK